MSDLLKTIRINELPEATTIQDNDVFLIEDELATRKITSKDLLACIKNYTEENGNYISNSTIGEANGIAPLNSDKKIENTYLNFGTATGTIYDGGKGQVLREDLDTHIDDTSIHYKHPNQSVLDSITQEKVDAWDASTGSDGSSGITSLTDLGINASADELNYMTGATSNIQTQLNEKAPLSHGEHVSYSTTTPLMNGTTSIGTASTVSRSDHVHPTDTSRAEVNHTQSASTITDGTLAGKVVAKENITYTDACLRNIAMVTTDPTEGTDTDYINGTLICVYE